MTPYERVYEAFLARILEDEWDEWLIEEAALDWRLIMEAAIPWFKFPRVSLERTDEGFNEALGSEEIQIIATYMKVEWLNRCVMTCNPIKYFHRFRFTGALIPYEESDLFRPYMWLHYRKSK